MRLFRHARHTKAATAAPSVAALITTSSGAAVAKATDPSKESGDFRKAVTVRGVAQHLDALQKVADANGGTRASGTPGYAASRNYIVQKLRAAGYRPETARGNPDNVVMTGAHLDSVLEGPGINDNGSGSATNLEIAEQLAKVKNLKNKVRFAWWGAEESGLLGAEHYVADLAENNPDALGDIALYLNYDMVGSPNFARFIYDGDNSTGEGAEGPEGSDAIEQVFSSYFASQRLATAETPFDGRSDYGPFIDNGVPAGGLFTGAEGVKTPEEAKMFGGTAGEAYDACYHQACDTRANISMAGLDQMSDAAAHAVYVLSRSTKAVNGQGEGHKSSQTKALAKAGARQAVADGHRMVR